MDAVGCASGADLEVVSDGSTEWEVVGLIGAGEGAVTFYVWSDGSDWACVAAAWSDVLAVPDVSDDKFADSSAVSPVFCEVNV